LFKLIIYIFIKKSKRVYTGAIFGLSRGILKDGLSLAHELLVEGKKDKKIDEKHTI